MQSPQKIAEPLYSTLYHTIVSQQEVPKRRVKAFDKVMSDPKLFKGNLELLYRIAESLFTLNYIPRSIENNFLEAQKLYQYILQENYLPEICQQRIASLKEKDVPFIKAMAELAEEGRSLSTTLDFSVYERHFLFQISQILRRGKKSALDDVLTALKKYLSNLIKNLKPQELLHLQDDRPVALFIRKVACLIKVAGLIAPHQVNSFLAPNVAKEDTFGNVFDTLLPGQFIIADNGVTFIQLQDFFKTAWEEIQNGERNVFKYAEAKGTIKSISENEKAQIIQFVPKAQQFFQLTAEFQHEQKGSVLSLLENLREALSLGDKNGHRGGDEFRAGPDANGGIATFYEAWELLPDDLKRTLRALRTPWGDETTSLGYILDHLFDPRNPTPEQEQNGVRQDIAYCISLLGGSLQSLIEANRAYLQSLVSNPKFYQLKELFKNIDSSFETPVINFMRAGQYATAKVLIDENPNCLQEKFPDLIMTEAIKYAPLDFVKDLLKKEPRFRQPIYFRLAVEAGRVSIFDSFVGELPKFMLDSLLLSAVSKGHLYIVDYICQKTNNFNVTLDERSPLDGKNALEVAIHYGHSDVTQYFLLKGLFSSSLNHYPAQLNVPDTLSAEVKSWLTIIKEVGSNFIPSVHQANNNNLVATSAFLKKMDKVVNFILDQFKCLPAWSPKRVHLTNKMYELSTCTTETVLDAKLAEIRDIVAKHRETGLKGFFKLNLWRNTEGHRKFNDTFRAELAHLPAVKQNGL